MSYSDLWHSLLPLYEESEAKAVARLVLETAFDLSYTDIVCGKVSDLSSEQILLLRNIFDRLLQGQPVQYILQEAWFCGHRFHVEPGVLIPRMETQWLVERIAQYPLAPAPDILDVCTGSGCIAVSVLHRIPDAHVEGWELSEQALEIAGRNVGRMMEELQPCKGSVVLKKQDALVLQPESERWDVIVSNPPYISTAEQAEVPDLVRCNEPQMALFVPEDEPLLFYKSIISYAKTALKRGGHVLFEINPHYSEEMMALFGDEFGEMTLIKDDFNHERYVEAIRIR